MKAVLCFCLAIVLCACSVRSSNQEQSGFYTWIDEQGQLRSEPIVVAKQETESADGELEEREQVATPAKDDFDTSEYMSADQVDAKLEQTRLYSWQEEGTQRVHEVAKQEEMPNRDLEGYIFAYDDTSNKVKLSTDCCEFISRQERFLWSEISSRQLKLKDYYTYYDELKSDAVLIELGDHELPNIRIKSFLRNGKMALPDLVFLDERFAPTQSFPSPFSHFVEETWASYGFMQGAIPHSEFQGSVYMLVLPSKQAGVLDLGSDQITIIDLGSIMLFTDEVEI